MNRDERAWELAWEQLFARRGIVPLKLLPCQECGAAVACRLGSDPPTSCEEHS